MTKKQLLWKYSKGVVMKKFIRVLYLSMVVALTTTMVTAIAITLGAPLGPQNAFAAKPGDTVSMDFVNVDINVVVKYISELTGKNFIIDEKVSGKVTIISPKPVSKKEAYKVFESILEVYGFLAIEVGEVTKIIPIAEGRQKAGRVQYGKKVSKSVRDQMITQLIPLKYVSADKLLSVLRPLIPPTSYVAAYSASNTLILVDLAGNRQRILDIVKQLDVEGVESTVKVHKLQYASAKEMERKISTILKTSGKKGKGATVESSSAVISDERLNALIVVGNELFLNKVESLITQLDIPAPAGRQEINVVYLKNADAEEMAKVLNKIAQDTKKQKGPKGKKGQVDDPVNIMADKATNSLVITANPEVFYTLSTVIEKLDIRRRQVFVEALIFEIRSDNTNKFGVEWRASEPLSETGPSGLGGSNFGNIGAAATTPISSLANPLNATQGLVLGVVDGTMTYGGETFVNIGGLISALRTEDDVNILSTPNLLTTDNIEAEIFVGENVPFVKSTAQTTGATPITNIERKDVGILLRITPQINENNYVKLNIFQEISSISPTQLDKASDIITFKRNARTTVRVKNKQTVVIGGLIRNDMMEIESAIPILGSIPIIGWLFKSSSKQNIKTNLLIFLTPHIITTDEDMESITEKKTKYMEDLKNPKKAAKERKKKAKEEKKRKKLEEKRLKELKNNSSSIDNHGVGLEETEDSAE
jgi:general secretion pathway protein D